MELRLIRASLAGFSALAAAEAVGRAFVFATPFKTPVFLHKHLDADADKSKGDEDEADYEEFPIHLEWQN